jgi:hypothetical protein
MDRLQFLGHFALPSVLLLAICQPV